MSTAPRFQFANSSELQPEFQPVPVYQPEDWLHQPTAKKPPRSFPEVKEVAWESATRNIPAAHAARNLGVEGLLNVHALNVSLAVARATATARDLDQTYVFENRPEVTRFIEVHRLHGLLLQASKPLKEKFGDDSVKTLSIVSDDEGFESLFCVVAASGDLRQTRQALRAFDREWWLHRARQAAGRLNFDFKMI